MALLDTAAGAAPAFLTKNYINRDCKNNGGITVSSGDSYKHRAYDMTRSSAWITEGSSDGVDATYEVTFYEGVLATARTFNAIALLGMNLKRFKVEYWDGSAWVIVTGLDFTATDFSSEDKIVGLATALTADKVKLTATSVQSGTGTEKYVGEFIVGNLTLQAPRGMAAYERSWDDNVKTVVMGDGSIDYTEIGRSDDASDFFRANINFVGLTRAERDTFLSLKRGAAFICLLEPGDVPGDAYLCRIAPDSFKDNYMSLRKDAGYRVSFRIEEIGGN